MSERFVKPKIDKYIQLYSKNAFVEDGTFDGSITDIKVTNGGYWYDDELTATKPIVTISAPNLAGGVQATADVIVNESLVYYPITGITITNAGSGYTTPPTVTITAPTNDNDNDDTNDGLMYIFAENGGSGYTSLPAITISAPDIAGGIQATAYAVLTDGVITSITIDGGGSGYTKNPTVSVTGGGGSGAVLKAYLYRGFGATAVASITLQPLTSTRFTWELETPVEVNENALLQVVDRQFTGISSADADIPMVIRMYEVSSKSIVNTLNKSRNNASFYQGQIVDIGKPDRNIPNDIKIEIQPQNIQRIALSVNQGISTNTGIGVGVEFVVILKVTEKEPSLIEYGSLNNINISQ